MEAKVALAVASVREGMNCCQAVITAFGSQAGLAEDVAVKIGSPFGGGIGRTGEVCGALTGATMILGLLFGPREATNPAAREEVYGLTRELFRRFRAGRSQVTCRELIECDLSTPEGYQLAIDRGVLKTLCPELVKEAASILADIITRETRSRPVSADASLPGNNAS